MQTCEGVTMMTQTCEDVTMMTQTCEGATMKLIISHANEIIIIVLKDFQRILNMFNIIEIKW